MSPSRSSLPLILLILSHSAAAQQQNDLDAGVDYGKSLIGGVQDQSQTTDVNTIPGYGGTNLPETGYYNSQNLTGMQTDAMNSLTSGAANDAAQTVYGQALQPKLQFGANDPILQNADATAQGALADPGVITVQSGSCTTQDVTQTETRLETCTAWIEPSNQTCNKTLNVDVTWDEQSSCPIGTTFSQVSRLHNASGTNDYVYARAFCNPGAPDGTAPLQFKASDGDPGDCTDWVSADLSTNQTTVTYTGALLRPQFYSSNTCINVPVFYEGSCDANNQCTYTLTYRELGDWTQWGDMDPQCSGTAMDLAAEGYTGPGSTYHNIFPDPMNGLYCVRRQTTVSISFERPNITKTPVVTDSWDNGCAFLESQTQ